MSPGWLEPGSCPIQVKACGHVEGPIHISRSPHRPLHAYAGGRLYWLTAATLEHHPPFRADERKQAFVAEFVAATDRWQVELMAWTLMERHYHAIMCRERGKRSPG